MTPSRTILATVLATVLSGPAAFAQATRTIAMGADDYPKAVWRDDAQDLVYLAGARYIAATNFYLPTVWVIDGNDQMTVIDLGMLPGGQHGDAYRFSSNGAYLTGVSASSGSIPFEGVRWTAGSWSTPQDFGSLMGYLASEGYAVSDTGRVLGGFTPGFVWEPSTAIVMLPAAPGFYGSIGFGFGMSADGNTVVGDGVTTLGVPFAMKWTNTSGVWTYESLTDPYGLLSAGSRCSPNGQYISGIISTGPLTPWVACLWEGQKLTLMNDEFGNLMIGAVARDVTDGGTQFGVQYRAYIWHESFGPNTLPLDDYYESHACSPPPTSFTDTFQVQETSTSYHLISRGADGLDYYLELPRVELPPSPSLHGSPASLSLATGGTQDLCLTAGVVHAGDLYLTLGSSSGTAPGVLVDGHVLPLNVDSYFLSTLTKPNGPVLSQSFGFLDAKGMAKPSFHLPAGLPPALAGLVVHHAAAILDLGTGQVSRTTDAAQVTLTL